MVIIKTPPNKFKNCRKLKNLEIYRAVSVVPINEAALLIVTVIESDQKTEIQASATKATNNLFLVQRINMSRLAGSTLIKITE